MPNIATFSCKIKGLFRRIKLVRLSDCLRKWDGLVEKAKELFLEMKGRGICPDVVVYSPLMHGLCSMDEWEEVDMLCQSWKMKESSELFELMAQRGKLETAWDLFYRMSNEGLKPTAVTYSIMIHGLCKEAKWKRQMICYWKWRTKVVLQITFNTPMLSFLQNNETQKVVEFLH
ncbi:hypothetical protein NC653_005429 [Populus alba x Populus x berolinensis]|uniref:Pentatricopeptide repeat-containing protein n=1 Tax=Populus alba x Populus x berolinensis TaxID=444605 RepID=A0AAD6RBW3_9ROSI|nr:hypothetical protein NC653_005429 [Populus alba x Populus x berolinensis]